MKPIPRLLLINEVTTANGILWLEGDGNYTRIHRQQQPMVLSAHTLKRFEERLVGFIRFRRDALVNPLHISRFQQNKSLSEIKVWLTDGTLIVASRRRYTCVRDVLTQATAPGTLHLATR